MDIRFSPIQVVIYGAPPDLTEPEFARSLEGKTVYRGEIEYLGPKIGLSLMIFGSEMFDPSAMEVEYGPTEDGWSDYQRGVMDALCATQGSRARIRGQIPFSWDPWGKGPLSKAGPE